jgi:Ni,Fe-hydrogenase III small subunit/ferredoxin
MIGWILRGLRCGVVTTRYPRGRRDTLPTSDSAIRVLDPTEAAGPLEAICPTGAILVDARHELSVDRGRCILCGLCVELAPERFAFAQEQETARRRRDGLVVGARPTNGSVFVRPTLAEQARPLRRSVHIRHVDAGSDGGEEWEIQALTNPYYDMQRLGLFFTASPRHADILLVTGGVTRVMEAPLRRTWEVMPEPKAVVAAGSDACSGGLAADGTVLGGVDTVLPVSVYVPGSPPTPISLLNGLLLAVGRLEEQTQ